MFDLLQQGPSAYIPAIIYSLLLTMLGYGLFPLIFANMKTTPTTKSKFILTCFGVNLLVWILFILLGSWSVVPYFLWTGVFASLGAKTLLKRELLIDQEAADREKKDAYIYGGKNNRPCPHCGQGVSPDALLCSHCGCSLDFTAVEPVKNPAETVQVSEPESAQSIACGTGSSVLTEDVGHCEECEESHAGGSPCDDAPEETGDVGHHVAEPMKVVEHTVATPVSAPEQTWGALDDETEAMAQAIAPEKVTHLATPVVCGIVSESAPAVPRPEVVQEATIVRRAYNSYLSSIPEERRYFEELLGSEELKAAYLEECERNQKKCDKGVRINYKQSYIEFMGVLHDVYCAPLTTLLSNEKSTPTPEPNVPAATPTVKKIKAPNNDGKHAFCKKCGSIIDPRTKECSGCGKRYFRAKTTVPIVFLTVLLVAAISLNVMQYLYGKEAIENFVTQAARIEELEKKVDSQKASISSQKSTIAFLEEKSGYFDTICKELSSGNIGYAANNFKSSESVIVVDKNETNRKFILTANWVNGGNVYVDYSGRAAYVSFDNNTWTTSTKMTIKPLKEGVTAVTFRNDVDSKAFKIIIVVT